MQTRFALFALAASAAVAHAAPVLVQVNGVVDYNVIQGSHSGIPSGAPVVMSFLLDPDLYVNSPNFPTRGYYIDLSSFQMTVGGASVIMEDPQPFDTNAYFVVRNNDPAADGFFISTNIDFPFPVSVFIPGLTPRHELNYLVTYPDTAIPSLDILDAVGSYDLTGLQVYNWTVGRFGNPGAEYAYQSMTISVIPAPSCAALLGMAGLAAARRRR